MRSIYNEEINELARLYFIIGNEHRIPKNDNPIKRLNSAFNTLGEQLLIHDNVTLKVYGENIPLAILINKIGLKNVEELIEKKALSFLLASPGVSTIVDDIPGVNPLQSFGKFSGPFGDPEESVMLGLNFLTSPLPRRERRNLCKKIEKNYILPPTELSKKAVEFGHQGYVNDLFANLGLGRKKELGKLNYTERVKLCDLAMQCYNLSLLSTYNMDSYNNYDLLQLNRDEFQRLKELKSIDHVVDEVLKIEGIPSFAHMFEKGILNLQDIGKLRSGKSAVKFREWVESISDSSDTYDISRAYIESITRKSFIEKPIGKITRLVSLTVVGGVLGGPVGAGAGAAIDLGLSVFDSFILDNIIKGWTPKYYIDEKIKPGMQVD